MALPATETFTASNGTSLGSLSEWTVTNGSFQIQSNELQPSGGAENSAYWNADTFNDDQYAEMETTAISYSGFPYLGPSVRNSTSGVNFYGIYRGGSDSYFFEMDGGSWIDLGTPSSHAAVGEVTRIEVEGTTITCYVEGVQVAQTTDATHTSGYAGICGYGNGTGRSDNWTAGNLGSAGTNQDLSGVLAGTVTYSASLDVTGSAALAGAIAGTIGYAGALSVAKPLNGTLAGTATYDADLLVSAPAGQIAEPFEDTTGNWIVNIQGGVTRSSAQARNGTYSAACASTGSPSYVYDAAFSSSAGTWEEADPRYNWQRAWVYVPSATVANLGASEYIDIAGYWTTSAGDEGWWLRIRQNADIYLAGYDSNGNSGEVDYYATFPTDQWVEVQAGLKTQNGPGVKRAIMFLVDGDAYGYLHQGRNNNTWNRSAFGIVRTNSSDSNTVYVDDWCSASTATTPPGQDNRPSGNVYEMDFTAQSGANWQIDWSTWRNNLVLDATYGLYSATDRYQSGFNTDRMPSLYDDGWAEIEIDWPNGTPNLTPNTASSYDQPMVGMRKNISLEENLEIYPTGDGTGNVVLRLEAWVGNPVQLDTWQLPLGTANPTSRILEPGDIIRTRWQNIDATDMRIRVDFYDASTTTWYEDAIDWTGDVTAITDGSNTVNYMDDRYKASSITIDSPSYSIRRFRAGTIETYPALQSLAGVVVGTATYAATLAVTKPLASTIAATATYSGTLSTTKPLAGAVAATITQDGALSLTKPLSSTAAGTLAYAGDLSVTADMALAGTISGTATYAAALSITKPLTGTISATATYAASLSATKPLAGAVAGATNYTATLSITKPLAATISGTATYAATLELAGQADLAGVIPGTLTYTGALVVTKPLAGAVAGSATLTGTLSITKPLTGTIPGTLAYAGDLSTSVGVQLSGAVGGTLTYTGVLAVTKPLAGAVAGNATLTGTLSITKPLAGSVPGTFGYTARFAQTHFMPPPPRLVAVEAETRLFKVAAETRRFKVE